jgi:tetratricopeptide (TPR) repeat protein
MSTGATSAEAPSPPPPAESAAAPLRGAILPVLALCSVLFVASLLVSWFIRNQTLPGEVEEPDESVVRNNKDENTLAGLLARGDRALQRHQFGDALSHYRKVQDTADQVAWAVHYRVGLCNESLGHADQATAAYRQALSSTLAPAPAVACQIGIARCLLRQKQPSGARLALYPLLLDEARQHGIAAAMLADARYLVALALAQETHRAANGPLSLDDLATTAEVALEVKFYLDESEKALESTGKAAKNPPPPPSTIVIKKATDRSPAVAQRIDVAEQPAQELLDRLAVEGGLTTHWSADAKDKAADRSLSLNISNCGLLELLEQTADRFDIICRLDGKAVQFSIAAEMDAKVRASQRRAMAQRVLKAAMKADPDHVLAGAACLELGNVEADAGKTGEAIGWYDRVLQEPKDAPYALAAYYNRAQLHLRRKAIILARKDFFHAIDQTPGHELAVRAYLRIGQLYLDDENTPEAIAQLRRGQAMGARSPYQPMITLTIAATYLAQGQPDEARRAMEAHRAVLHQEPYRNTAGFLDCYARYQIARANGAVRREATDLISTLWQNQDKSFLGPLGLSLLAQAYGDLGFWEQAEGLLRRAAAEKRGALTISIEYKLAETLLLQNQRQKAQPIFEKIAASSSRRRNHANYQLARLDLQDQKWKECAAKCQAIWQDGTFPESAALLHLWGSALEGLGDYDRAARCFAGKAP